MERSAYAVNNWIQELLLNWGFSAQSASYLKMLILFVLAVALIYVILHVVKYIIKTVFENLAKINNFTFLRLLVKNRFPIRFAYLLPYVFIKNLIPFLFEGFPKLIEWSDKLVDVWLVILIVNILISVIKTVADLLHLRPAFRDIPMTSYIQVISIILWIIGAVVIFSELTGQSPTAFFAAMGAASAVLLLMFQDSIKGFVASIQVTSNDMVRLGDWITVPKYGADGDVIEINLTTVKVRNFDKTISTLPTYALIADSFQNWRGMVDASGRRIKRSLLIKQSSIRFIPDEELVRFKKIQGIAEYIDRKNEEIRLHNESINADRSLPVNGRNLTNAGLFRHYTEWYLKSHPGTKSEYTTMVRQLSPNEHGIPFEVYVFTNTTNWVKYESIMADIFDHLIAAVKYFDLELFELEAGGDVKRLQMQS